MKSIFNTEIYWLFDLNGTSTRLIFFLWFEVRESCFWVVTSYVFFYMVLSNMNFFNRSIWSIDRILWGTTNLVWFGLVLWYINHCWLFNANSLITHTHTHTRLTKVRTAIDRLSIIWKSDLTDKMKRSFFQAEVVSIQLYGCTTWTLTKRLEKKLDGNYTRMLRAILNKSRQQHPIGHQLYGHLLPITKTIQVRRTRHAGTSS